MSTGASRATTPTKLRPSSDLGAYGQAGDGCGQNSPETRIIASPSSRSASPSAAPPAKTNQSEAASSLPSSKQQRDNKSPPTGSVPAAGATIGPSRQVSVARQRRPYNVVIFAASSSVGRFLVEEMSLVVNKHHSSSNQMATSEPSQFVHQQQQQQQETSRRQSVPSSSKLRGEVRWAIAGRSAVRLSETLCRAELSTGIHQLTSSVPVILADLNHQRSLLEMCEKTDILINCAGPYSDLGAEILIKACIECGTNYIDLAHETTFVEMINQKYSEQARRRGVYILNGCGFQSMSAEMGLNFTKQVADGRIEQVKIILSLSDTKSVARLSARTSGIISEGMWNSLLTEKAQEVTVEERLRLRALPNGASRQTGDALDDNGLSQMTASGEIAACDHGTDHNHSTMALLKSKRPLTRKDTRSLVKDIIQFKNRNVSSLAWPLQFVRSFQSQQGRGYCWPVDILTGDESQLIRGEMNNYELRRPDFESSEGWRPIRCTTFVSVKHFTHLCLLFVWIYIFQLLVKFSLARYLMRKLPTVASLGHVATTTAGANRWSLMGAGCGGLSAGRGDPSGSGLQQQLDRDSLSHIKYCQTFIAYGTPGDDAGDPLEDRQLNRNRSHVQLLVARVVGPEPNHVTTASMAIQAALTMFMERDHLPGSGGVLTPGAAFSETNIIYQLRRRNIKFEVLKKA